MDTFHLSSKGQLQQIEQGDLHAAFKIYIEKIRGGMKYRKEVVDKFNYVKEIQSVLNENLSDSDNQGSSYKKSILLQQ